MFSLSRSKKSDYHHPRQFSGQQWVVSA